MDSPLWLAVNFIILPLSLLNLQAVKSCASNEFKILTDAKGRFSSPNFPTYFQKATQCIWLISVDPDYVVTLEFEKFEVGHNTECLNRESRTSYVEVRDGSDYKNRTIAIYCGSSTPKEISSTGNQMWIKYVTNGYRSTKFDARYSATKDSSVVTIMLLALVAILGAILCISITIAIVKRNQSNLDDEAGLSPSRDLDAEMDNNRACALEQIPGLVLMDAADELNEDRMNCSNEQRVAVSLSNKRSNDHVHSHVHDHVDTRDVQLHGQRFCGSHDNNTNRRSMGEDNMVVTDIDIEEKDTIDGLRAPTEASERRSSHSESILTSTKVIFVQDSSYSRCSTSSSSKSCD